VRVVLLILLAVWSGISDAHQDPPAAKTLLIIVDDLTLPFGRHPNYALA